MKRGKTCKMRSGSRTEWWGSWSRPGGELRPGTPVLPSHYKRVLPSTSLSGILA